MKQHTLSSAAELLGGVSPDSLRKAVQRGTMKATLLGRTYLVTEREVERYREKHLGRRGRPAKD